MSWILLAMSLLLAQGSSAARATIQGQVLARGTNQPVAHAQIVLAKVGGTEGDYRTGVSDQGGRFVFANVAAGTYRLFAERQGYLRAEHGRRTANGPGVPLVVPGNQSPPPVVVTMIPTGVIAGRVLDESHPARGVLVRAMKAVYRDGERSVALSGYAETNDLGEYRIFGLAPGPYLVSALPPNGPRIEGDTYVVPQVPSNANRNQSQRRTLLVDALASGDVDPDALVPGLFVASFYPGTTDEHAAVAVDVPPGSAATGIDLAVARTTAARVRGRLFNGATGRPADGVNIAVRSSSTSVSIPGVSVTGGTFELPMVPPGRYELIARTTTTGQRLYGTASIQIGSADVDGVEIRLQPGVTLSGHLAVAGGSPPGPILVQLVQASAGAVPVRPDGTFTIENLETGAYRIRVLARGQIAPVSATFGGDDVTNTPVSIDPGTQGRTLEIAVDFRKGGLDATVVDRSRRPVAGMTVALVPAAPRRDRSELYRTATTDAAGVVHLDDVAPGDYTIMAADIEPADWQNPDVLRVYEGRGQPLHIDADSRRLVTLRVDP